MGQTSERLDLNERGAFLSAGLPSPSSLRDATSPKVRGLGSPPSLLFSTLRPAAARGAVRRCAQTFRLCQGLPLWGSWTPLGGLRGRGRWWEPCAFVQHCLAEAQPYRKHDLNLGSAPPSAALPSPSSLRDATSPKVRGLGSPPSFRFEIFTPCCRKGSRQALRSDFTPLPRAPTLGELARSA